MISIIIPFNDEKYLDRCLQSLQDLKYYDFEVILVDDFCLGNPAEIIRKYSKELNIKYTYTKEKTIGVGNARNIGIQESNGEYIMFVDVDDLVESDLLINLEKYINQDIEIIKYKMKIIYEDKEILTKGPVFDLKTGEEGFNKLCFKDKYLDSPCLYLIKKELFERTNLKFEKNSYHEDFGLIPELIVNAKSIVSTKYYGYNYIQTEDSIMRNNDYEKVLKRINDKFNLYTKIYKNLDKYEISRKTKQNLLEYYTNSIILALKDLNKSDREYFEKRIKKRGLIKNIKTRNLKQFIKKLILNIDMEWYLKWQK